MRVTLVGPCRYVSVSPVFSMPVWRYPSTGLLRRTVSPSSSSMSRSTPCVDGCWGPMLMIMVSSSDAVVSARAATSASDIRRTDPTSRISSPAVAPLRGPISCEPSEVRAASWEMLMSSPGVLDALELHRDGADGMVLAQRVALPVLGHEDPGQVGMADELDPEHVVHLALEGLGPGVDLEQRRARRIVARHLDPQAEPLAGGVRQQADHDLEPLGLDAGRQRARGLVRDVVDGGHVDADPEALVVAQVADEVDELVAPGVQHGLAPAVGDRHAPSG